VERRSAPPGGLDINDHVAARLGKAAVDDREADRAGHRPVVTLAHPDPPAVALADLGRRLPHLVDLVLVRRQPRPQLGAAFAEVEQCFADGVRWDLSADVEVDAGHRGYVIAAT
jgi:hypothetical protein